MTRRASRGSNKNRRPPAHVGRALKAWMLAEFGDGITAPCSFCERPLLWSEMTKDLWPKPARKGGRYVRGNIRPACMSCNARDGAKRAAEERTIERLKHEARLRRRRELYAVRGGRAGRSRETQPHNPVDPALAARMAG